MPPRLFFTAPNGPEGTQLQVHCDGQGSVRQVASAIESGDVLPPGSYTGQPLVWSVDEERWIPIGEDSSTLRVDEIGPPTPGTASMLVGDGGFFITGETAQLNDNLAHTIVRATALNFLCSYNDDVAPFVQVRGDADGLLLQAGKIGFLAAAAPIAAPALSGSTLQAQVNSLVAALAALGLVTDARPAHPAPFTVRFANNALTAIPATVVIPANSPSGYYRVTVDAVCRANAVGGTYQVTGAWTTAGAVACTQTFGNLATGTAGTAPVSTVREFEFGTGTAFTITGTPAGIGGAPSFDISFTAEYLGPIV